MTRLRVSVRRFWCKLWWWWYMEVKLIRMVEIVLSLHQSFLLPIIAIAKPLCFPLGWKFCIDPLVGEAKLSTRLDEKCTCNYWNCQYGCVSEKKSDSWPTVGVFSCQLFFYQKNQLEVSCMQPLCSIANQEKVNRLIYLVHRVLLMQKTIKEI